MTTMPSDSEGRYWAQTEWSESPAEQKKGIGTLIAADKSGKLRVLGSAFVIEARDDAAICLAAAHSFEQSKSDEPRRADNSQFNVAAPFRSQGPNYIDTSRIQATFNMDGEGVSCSIGQVNYAAGYDVAVFTVNAPNARKIFSRQIALDLCAPSVGEEVAILCNIIAVEEHPSDRYVVEQQFDLRWGVVTEVNFERTSMPGQSVVFRTTIPVSGGMSGAPVVSKPSKDGPIIARGVVSSDLSDPESLKSYTKPGRSTATMLWPSMGLELAVQRPPHAAGPVFLASLLDNSMIDNRTVAAKVHVRESAGRVEVLYVDHRINPVYTALFSRAANPRA